MFASLVDNLEKTSFKFNNWIIALAMLKFTSRGNIGGMIGPASIVYIYHMSTSVLSYAGKY